VSGAPTELVLFPFCPVPGCSALVEDPREVCAGCVAAFGPYLRPGSADPTAAEFAEAIAERDRTVAELLADRYAPSADEVPQAGPGDEWRRNQQCWCCEERRTCRADTDHRDRWICKTCEAIR
jgi:hypothetical protein